MNKKKKILIIVTLCFFIFAAVFFALIPMVIVLYSRKNLDLDNDERLFNLARSESYTEYYADSGDDEYVAEKISEVALGIYKKKWVALDDVSDNLKNGFIAMEDRRFFEHSGIDIRRTVYAAANTLFNFKTRFGASTITQQVIKNISGDNGITFKRKFNEIIRAYNIEKRHSKEEILEVYLNIIPMGNNIIGISDASYMYFGKAPSELSVAEAATLVGITNAPTRYDPYNNFDRCIEKRNTVIQSMLDFGVINENVYKSALIEPLYLKPKEKECENVNSWFIETVNNEIIEDLCEKYALSREAAEMLLSNGGLKVYTTEKIYIQQILEDYFEDESNFPGQIKDGLEFAMAVCDSKNGNLVAIVGAVGKKDANKLLNHALVPHTPGSSLKPLALYAPLIDSGEITWATVFDDIPIMFKDKNGCSVPYPMNYPNVYSGLTTVKDALRLSKNTVAMNLYNMIGAEQIFYNLKYLYGFDTLVRNIRTTSGEILTDLAPAPLALGQLSYGVPLRDLTEAYTAFSTEGILYNGKSYLKVLDADGNLLLDNSQEGKRIYSKEGARIMNALLSQVVEDGTASKIKLKEIIDTAGKTGTSGNDHDRLFVGYTPYLCAGIWCGYKNGGRSINKSAPSHLKIWDDIMIRAHSVILEGKSDSEIEVFSQEGLIKAGYCKDSGRRYSPDCELDPRGHRFEYGYFLNRHTPNGLCDRHIRIGYDVSTGAIANPHCPLEDVVKISLLKLPNRSFPQEVVILDAEYMFIPLKRNIKLPESYEKPYFYYMIPDGEFVGIGADRKQFNSYCYLHDG